MEKALEMKRFLIALMIAPIFSTSTASAETLLCVEQVSGGMKFMEGDWQATKFKTGLQYVVTERKNDPFSYDIKEMGKADPIFSCTRNSYSGQLSSRIICGGLGYGMIVDFSALKFMTVYTMGYIEDDRSGNNTPAVTGGKCSTITQ